MIYWFLILWLIGTLLAFPIQLLCVVRKIGKITLSDLVLVIIFSFFSWLTIIIFTAVEGDDIVIWEKKRKETTKL